MSAHPRNRAERRYAAVKAAKRRQQTKLLRLAAARLVSWRAAR